jgi:hypothetical protein
MFVYITDNPSFFPRAAATYLHCHIDLVMSTFALYFGSTAPWPFDELNNIYKAAEGVLPRDQSEPNCDIKSFITKYFIDGWIDSNEICGSDQSNNYPENLLESEHSEEVLTTKQLTSFSPNSSEHIEISDNSVRSKSSRKPRPLSSNTLWIANCHNCGKEVLN